MILARKSILSRTGLRVRNKVLILELPQTFLLFQFELVFLCLKTLIFALFDGIRLEILFLLFRLPRLKSHGSLLETARTTYNFLRFLLNLFV